MSLPDLYTAQEVADSLGMSERWLRGRIKDGAEHTRMGNRIRFTPEQVKALVDGHAKTPAATSITTGRKKRA